MTGRKGYRGESDLIYFTSDLHFGHRSIIQLCHRPFSDVEEMNAALIDNWNRKVRGNDTVYIVGDLLWKGVDSESILRQLKGKKVLIVGNHDANWMCKTDCLQYFEDVTSLMETSLCNHPVTLCHYPMLAWKGSRKIGTSKLGYLLHGHIHNNTDRPEYMYLFQTPNALNVGVDINHFEPVTFEELEYNNMVFKRKILNGFSD